MQSEERVVRRQPLLHAALEERLLSQLEVLLGELDADRAEHLRHGVVLLVHAVLEHLGDRRDAEHAESALEARRRAGGDADGGDDVARVEEAVVGLHRVHRLVLRGELQQALGLLDVGDRLPVQAVEHDALDWPIHTVSPWL